MKNPNILKVAIVINSLLILFLIGEFNTDLSDMNFLAKLNGVFAIIIYLFICGVFIVFKLFKERKPLSRIILAFQIIFFLFFIFKFPQPYHQSIYTSEINFLKIYFMEKDAIKMDIVSTPIYINSYDPAVDSNLFAHQKYTIALYKYQDSIAYDGSLSIYSQNSTLGESKEPILDIHSKSSLYKLLQEKDRIYWDQLAFFNMGFSFIKLLIILIISIFILSFSFTIYEIIRYIISAIR